MQNYTDNANGNVPLTVENVWYFWFIWVQDAHMFFCKKNKAQWSIVFFTKTIFLYYGRIEITCKNQSNFQITVVLKITLGYF